MDVPTLKLELARSQNLEERADGFESLHNQTRRHQVFLNNILKSLLDRP